MRLTIAYSKTKKRNRVLINNDTHQRETLSERPIRPPLNHFPLKIGFWCAALLLPQSLSKQQPLTLLVLSRTF